MEPLLTSLRITGLLALLGALRILPQAVRDWTAGADFNLAYLAFFACTTLTLWNG